MDLPSIATAVKRTGSVSLDLESPDIHSLDNNPASEADDQDVAVDSQAFMNGLLCITQLKASPDLQSL